VVTGERTLRDPEGHPSTVISNTSPQGVITIFDTVGQSALRSVRHKCSTNDQFPTTSGVLLAITTGRVVTRQQTIREPDWAFPAAIGNTSPQGGLPIFSSANSTARRSF